MSDVTAQIVIRFVSAARAPETVAALLQRVGLTAELQTSEALHRKVAIETYYDLLERAAGADDHALPIRYGQSVRPEDFGAMGLALKTALDLREALERILRYVAVLTNSLGYALQAHDGDWVFALQDRPHHRRGAQLANEGALCAVLSLLRQIATAPVTPLSVSFRHPPPADCSEHRRFFGCPIAFAADLDRLCFDAGTLAIATRLGDPGLSAFLLAHLEGLRARAAEPSLVESVRRAVADALCDGPPRQARIARRLGMSERTLHRRLADHGESFRSIAEGARRELCESLLADPSHSLAEVAFLTGFSEQSAFQRAFKRWSGQTPTAFRKAGTPVATGR